jgi:hypothetical protein
MAHNASLLGYRQTAEWGMRALQGAFGRLRVPLDINDTYRRVRIIELSCRMHNVRTLCMGINQIRSVYAPDREVTDEDRMWDNFHDMLFKDIRKFDRVSRFHLHVVHE